MRARCAAWTVSWSRPSHKESERHQETRERHNRRPGAENVETLRVINQRFPVLRRRINIPSERCAIDRDGSHDADAYRHEDGESSRILQDAPGAMRSKTVNATADTAEGTKNAGTTSAAFGRALGEA